MEQEKQDLAEKRTDWAEDRTKLANERTFAGWMRTAMASVAVAIGLKAVFGAIEPMWVAKAVATVFIAAAVLMVFFARRQACETQMRLDAHSAETQGSRRVTLIAGLLALASLATAGVLWAL